MTTTTLMFDFTEEEKIKTAARLKEESMRRIMDNIPAAILELDMDFKLTYCNRRLSKMVGYSTDELLGYGYHRWFLDGDRDVMMSTLH